MLKIPSISCHAPSPSRRCNWMNIHFNPSVLSVQKQHHHHVTHPLPVAYAKPQTARSFVLRVLSPFHCIHLLIHHNQGCVGPLPLGAGTVWFAIEAASFLTCASSLRIDAISCRSFAISSAVAFASRLLFAVVLPVLICC